MPLTKLNAAPRYREVTVDQLLLDQDNRDITLERFAASVLRGSGLIRTATVVVAASDSSNESQAQASYSTALGRYLVCDGISDEVEVQAAIDALPATGGKIVLLDGSYSFGARLTINNSYVTLEAQEGSIITRAAAANVEMIGDNNVAYTDFTLIGGQWDGNGPNQGAGYPIIWAQNSSSHRWKVRHCTLKNNAVAAGGQRGANGVDLAGDYCQCLNVNFDTLQYGVYGVGDFLVVQGCFFYDCYIGMSLQNPGSKSIGNSIYNISHCAIYLYAYTQSIGDIIIGGTGSGITTEYGGGDCQIISPIIKDLDSSPLHIGYSTVTPQQRITIRDAHVIRGTGTFTSSGIRLMDDGNNVAFSDINIEGGIITGFDRYGVEEVLTGGGSTVARCILLGVNLQGNSLGTYLLPSAAWEIGHCQP